MRNQTSSIPSRRAPTLSGLPLARLARLTATAAFCFAATAAYADGRITGRVTDAATKSGLPGAEVTLNGTKSKAITASDGSFTLDAPAGTYELNTYYLGYPSQTTTTTVTEGATTPALITLGDSEIVTLESFNVEGAREGQARAINQQRTSSNLVSIISSDLSGQFPDKTIADAVKRLPGVTVETDTDTGGSEGRYITIRGMNADFNAVSINGIRASVSDFSGLSRRVPLDVVSAKTADQIEVTKALRPDQDGDGIGGAVNIVTRSPFDRDGIYASAEASATYSALSDDYTSDFPHKDPGTEFSAAFGTQLGKDSKHGIFISANHRDRAFLKQRVSATGWRTNSGAYRPVALALQHFYDDVQATGINGTYEWRPTADAKFRLDTSFNNRDTERGRDRQVVNYGTPDAGGVITGDTYTQFTNSAGTSGATRRIERNVRQFFETQTIFTTGLSGDVKSGDWTFTPLLGLNQGNFDGDPTKDVSARFRSSRGTLTYTANGYTPQFTTTAPRNDPTNYFLNTLDRGSSSVTETTYTGGLDAKLDTTLLDGDGFWKIGVKTSMFERDYTKVENFFFRNAGPDYFANQALADYRASSTLNGAYDYGFFIDPNKVRNFANSGGLDSPAVDNAARALVNSYDAAEDIHAGFAMGQFTWGQLTALTGARIELSRVEFSGRSGEAFNDSAAAAAVFASPGVTYASLGYTGGDINPASITPYTESNDYVDVLPGLHLRYEQSKKLQYRFAVTRSLARPRLADLNPTRLVDNNLDEVTQGNIKLDPTRSTNLDLGAEYYFSDAGTLSVGFFYKDMTDNIYTTRSFIAGGPLNGYNSIARANAKSAQVRGFELGYDQQFTFLPAPFDGLGAFANYTYADSEVDTGLAQFSATDLPLFNQVENTVNVGLFYEKKGFRTRVSLLYRSESLIDLSTDATTLNYDPKLSRYLAPTTTLDVTASYRFLKNWEVFTQFSNVLGEAGKAYDGTEARMDYNEITEWSGSLGFRWNL